MGNKRSKPLTWEEQPSLTMLRKYGHTKHNKKVSPNRRSPKAASLRPCLQRYYECMGINERTCYSSLAEPIDIRHDKYRRGDIYEVKIYDKLTLTYISFASFLSLMEAQINSLGLLIYGDIPAIVTTYYVDRH